MLSRSSILWRASRRAPFGSLILVPRTSPKTHSPKLVHRESKPAPNALTVCMSSVASITAKDRGFVMTRHQKRYAMLVDAENTQHSAMQNIVEELASLGCSLTVRRVYGDFTRSEIQPWRRVALDLSLRSSNSFAYTAGKGSSDAALIIDAMDLLHANEFLDGFVLVSSDSDFTSLAQRLRESGKHVVGVGKKITPAPFVTACERFIYIENLNGDKKIGDKKMDQGPSDNDRDINSSPTATSEPKPLKLIIQSVEYIRKTFYTACVRFVYQYTENIVGDKKMDQGTSGNARDSSQTDEPKPLKLMIQSVENCRKTLDDGSDEVNLGLVGKQLLQLRSDFDVRTYGYKSLSELFASLPNHFEMRKKKSSYYVKIRE